MQFKYRIFQNPIIVKKLFQCAEFESDIVYNFIKKNSQVRDFLSNENFLAFIMSYSDICSTLENPRVNMKFKKKTWNFFKNPLLKCPFLA